MNHTQICVPEKTFVVATSSVAFLLLVMFFVCMSCLCKQRRRRVNGALIGNAALIP